MLHQLHQTYLLLGHPPARTQVLQARGRRITLRQRLRGLLRAPAYRIPLGGHHA
jgi:hypothetical protein